MFKSLLFFKRQQNRIHKKQQIYFLNVTKNQSIRTCLRHGEACDKPTAILFIQRGHPDLQHAQPEPVPERADQVLPDRRREDRRLCGHDRGVSPAQRRNFIMEEYELYQDLFAGLQGGGP